MTIEATSESIHRPEPVQIRQTDRLSRIDVDVLIRHNYSSGSPHWVTGPAVSLRLDRTFAFWYHADTSTQHYKTASKQNVVAILNAKAEKSVIRGVHRISRGRAIRLKNSVAIQYSSPLPSSSPLPIRDPPLFCSKTHISTYSSDSRDQLSFIEPQVVEFTF